MGTQATLSVCEDMRFESSGKLLLVGVYTADIGIATEEFVVQQLVFLFNIEFDYITEERHIISEVTLPGYAPRRHEFRLPAPPPRPERDRAFLRQVVLYQNEPVNPGRIDARVIIDGIETQVAAPWIVLQSVEQAAMT